LGDKLFLDYSSISPVINLPIFSVRLNTLQYEQIQILKNNMWNRIEEEKKQCKRIIGKIKNSNIP